MPHPLVKQLHFTRQKWFEGLKDVSSEDALARFEPINSIGWMIGHLAWQEQHYWLLLPGHSILFPELLQFASGEPASTPPLDEVWDAWHTVTGAADTLLNTLSAETLGQTFVVNGVTRKENIGTMLLRNIYHYWYHLGEAQAVRQLLGHVNLPPFVGAMQAERDGFMPGEWDTHAP